MLQESESSAFQFQPVWGLHFLWSVCNHPPPQGGGLILQNSLKIVADCYLNPFRRNQESFDSCVIILIVNCLSLLFGTGRGRGGQQEAGGVEGLGPCKVPQDSARFQSPLFFDIP